MPNPPLGPAFLASLASLGAEIASRCEIDEPIVIIDEDATHHEPSAPTKPIQRPRRPQTDADRFELATAEEKRARKNAARLAAKR